MSKSMQHVALIHVAREEIGFRLYRLGRALVNAAARLDPTISTEANPSAATLAHGLDALGVRMSEVLELAEAKAASSK